MRQANTTIGARRPIPEAGIIDIHGDFTGAAEETLMTAYTAASTPETRAIILNFHDLDYMNSTGIGLLVTLLIRVNRQKQRLLAIGLNDHYRQIFELTRLNEAIQTYDTEADALAAVSASRSR